VKRNDKLPVGGAGEGSTCRGGEGEGGGQGVPGSRESGEIARGRKSITLLNPHRRCRLANPSSYTLWGGAAQGGGAVQKPSGGPPTGKKGRGLLKRGKTIYSRRREKDEAGSKKSHRRGHGPTWESSRTANFTVREGPDPDRCQREEGGKERSAKSSRQNKTRTRRGGGTKETPTGGRKRGKKRKRENPYSAREKQQQRKRRGINRKKKDDKCTGGGMAFPRPVTPAGGKFININKTEGRLGGAVRPSIQQQTWKKIGSPVGSV